MFDLQSVVGVRKNMEMITVKNFPDRVQFEAFCPICQKHFALFALPDAPEMVHIKSKDKLGWMAQHKNHKSAALIDARIGK